MSALQNAMQDLRLRFQPALDQLDDAWEALPEERRRLLRVVGIALAAVLPLLIVVLPLIVGRVSAHRNLADAREQLETMRHLERVVLERGLAEQTVEKKPRASAQNTSLIARMDGIANAAKVGGLVQSMRPVNKTRGDEDESEAVEIQLNGLVLGEIVKLLYEIEYNDKPLVVQRLEMQKESRDPDHLRVSLEVMQ